MFLPYIVVSCCCSSYSYQFVPRRSSASCRVFQAQGVFLLELVCKMSDTSNPESAPLGVIDGTSRVTVAEDDVPATTVTGANDDNDDGDTQRPEPTNCRDFYRSKENSKQVLFAMLVGQSEFETILAEEPFSQVSSGSRIGKKFYPANQVYAEKVIRRWDHVLTSDERNSYSNGRYANGRNNGQPAAKRWQTSKLLGFLKSYPIKDHDDLIFIKVEVIRFKSALTSYLSDQQEAESNADYWSRRGWAGLIPLLRFIHVCILEEFRAAFLCHDAAMTRTEQASCETVAFAKFPNDSQTCRMHIRC